MTKFRIFALLFILISLIFPPPIAFADTGPKPTMEFEFKQEMPGAAVTIVSGTLYECNQPDCSDASRLEEHGPQRFQCDARNCNALAYGFSDYHRLEIRFSDGKTRQSNIFKTAGFNSRYAVTIRPNDLLVEAQFTMGILPPTITILIACVCALIAGAVLVVGLIIFIVRRSRKS